MNLEIDSLNQCCDGLKIKARGTGTRRRLSEYCEAERKYKAAAKNFIIVRNILISVTLCKFKITPGEQAVFPQRQPSIPGWLRSVFGTQGRKED